MNKDSQAMKSVITMEMMMTMLIIVLVGPCISAYQRHAGVPITHNL